jgi:hypothetical protein
MTASMVHTTNLTPRTGVKTLLPNHGAIDDSRYGPYNQSDTPGTGNPTDGTTRIALVDYEGADNKPAYVLAVDGGVGTLPFG